jgi:hypothetical protein
MAGKWSEILSDYRRRLRELAKAVEDALSPPPELVPVPVPTPGRKPKS